MVSMSPFRPPDFVTYPWYGGEAAVVERSSHLRGPAPGPRGRTDGTHFAGGASEQVRPAHQCAGAVPCP